MSTKDAASLSEAELEREFEKLAEPTLEELTEALDDLDDERIEVDLMSGVLTIDVEGAGTMVVNSHRAARQIWLASGAQAWHFDWDGASWVSGRNGDELWGTVGLELARLLGREIELVED